MKGSRRISRVFWARARFGSATRRRARLQNDVYGSVVLAATQMFVDERLPRKGDEALFRLLEGLGERAIVHAFEPDAGLWEYRTRARAPHLFGDTVLGGLRPARRHCAAAQNC